MRNGDPEMWYPGY